MQTANIRPMLMSDLTEIVAIENALQFTPWTQKLFVDSLQAGHICEVLTLDNKIIGFAVMRINLDEAELLNIAITQTKQRQGFAQQLLNYLLKMAIQHKVKCIYLEVRKSNTAAIQFYCKNGFVQIAVRKNYYKSKLSGREDALILAYIFKKTGLTRKDESL
jgi:ribosomal-protein-alanine N-acetyltransferase